MGKKTLVINTAIKHGNGEFFDVKILGLTSAEWIKRRLGGVFDNIVCGEKHIEGAAETDWDAPLFMSDFDGVVLGKDTFSFIEEYLRGYVIDEMRKNGVRVRGGYVYADATVTYEAGAEIYSPNVIEGNCHISKNAVIYPYCFLKNCLVGEDSVLKSVYADNCRIGADCEVGPFAYLRPRSVIGDGCRVGDFVEVKNAVLGDGVKAAHLSYIGDAEVGGGTNIGCGVVFANYDGKRKNTSTVGRDCFLGSNVNLVAPVTLGDRVFVAAGTTVTDNADDDSFVIGRSKQQTKKRR